MTLKEFEEKIKADSALSQKLQDAKKNIKDASKPMHEAMSEIAKGLGFDVPASEFKLSEISKGNLSDEELQAVTGGADNESYCDATHIAGDEGRCIYDYVDTDCVFRDYCDGLYKKYDDCTVFYGGPLFK